MMKNTRLAARYALCALCTLAAMPAASIAASVKKAPVPAGKPVAAAPVRLPQQAIHMAYNEGDFDMVVAEIEAFTKANHAYSRGDSIFIAKHLAVVHSANPNTREKGKYYMYRLLEMLPSAELVDMYVSDEIDRIFERVRKEFLARQKSFGVDSAQMSIPDSPPSASPAVASAPAREVAAPAHSADRPFYKRRGFWIMTGAGIAAVGAVVTYVYAQDETEGRTIRIGNQTTP